jgi:tetratricopeptide (TPR) repeat protein
LVVVVFGLVSCLAAVAWATEDVAELIREGVSLQQDGKLQDASQRFSAALELEADNDEALLRLADTYAAMARYDLCADTAKQALKGESPFAGQLFATLGSCYAADGKASKALKAYRSGLQRNPDDADLNYKLAAELAIAGKNRDAIEHLKSAVRVRPSFGPAYYLLGRLFVAEDCPVPAMYCYMRFVSIEPNGPRSSKASKEVFRLLDLGASGTSAGGPEGSVGALLSFVADAGVALDGDEELLFTREHLGRLPLAMHEEGLFEPFAWVLAARAGIEGATGWIQGHPVRFRELNRFLAQQRSASEG